MLYEEQPRSYLGFGSGLSRCDSREASYYNHPGTGKCREQEFITPCHHIVVLYFPRYLVDIVGGSVTTRLASLLSIKTLNVSGLVRPRNQPVPAEHPDIPGFVTAILPASTSSSSWTPSRGESNARQTLPGQIP